MLRVLRRLIGLVEWTLMSREEAASWLLEREIRIVVRPVIVEVQK
jgi:hypothetical protein